MNADRLNRLLEKHHQWIESDGQEGERVDLRNEQLQYANFSGENLHSADLRGANLGTDRKEIQASLDQKGISSLDFQRTKLPDANLSEADLRSADLTGADLSGADLRGADLRNANLQYADLSGANLSNSDLRNCLVHKANCNNTNFENSDLRGIDLSTPILKETIFLSADLRDTLFCTIERTEEGREYIFNVIICCDFRYSDLRKSIFSDSIIMDSDFSESDLREAEFFNADISGTNFKEAQISYNQLLGAMSLCNIEVDEDIREKIKSEAPHIIEDNG